MNKPTVTVITPVYNRGQLLKATMKSVLSQSHSDFEYVIVDDCSTEDIETLVRQFDDPRLVYVRHSVNKMLAESYNTGIRTANGRYFAFVESDDVWHRDKLEKQLAVFKNNKSVGAVYCGMVVKDTKGNEIRKRIPRARGHVFGDVMQKSVISSMSTLMITQTALEQAGMFNSKYEPASSYEFELRLAKYTDFDFVPDIDVDYLQHDKNLSNDIDKDIGMQIRFHELILDAYSRDFKEFPDQYVAKLSSLGMNHLLVGNQAVARAHFVAALGVKTWSFKNWRNLILSCLPGSSRLVEFDRLRKLRAEAS